ncbi:hypothetical protein [Hyalangium gracile]|uniref:hypothetical protein n=1 Tax=Hyalangium gracile TaxID=394092 RepID=UPI001CCF6599|nr:hypothetical protein [Hyalangium gracile]
MFPKDGRDAEVKQDRTFTLEPFNAVGVSFVPRLGNVGGYPLKIVVDGDDKNPVTITGPGYWRSSTVVAKLEVDATPGGGAPGDFWSVAILPANSTMEEPRLRTDVDGFLQVRAPGARVLFDINGSVDPVPFLAAFGNGQTGFFYISPTNPSEFGANLTAWDVARFSNVQFVVEQLAASGLAWSCKPFVDMTHASNGLSLRFLEMGSDKDFGASAAPAWVPGENGFIHLGAGISETTAYQLATPHRTTHVRFGVHVGVNTENWGGLSWGGTFHLRMRGLAW